MGKFRYQFIKEQIITGEELLLARYVLIRENKKTSIQGFFGKINDPDKYALVELYVDLIDRYGYSVNQIDFDVFVPNSKELVDMAAYEDEEKKKPHLVVECRKKDVSDADFEQGVKQAVDNALLLKAPFAVCVAGDNRRIIHLIDLDKKNPKETIITDIPSPPNYER